MSESDLYAMIDKTSQDYANYFKLDVAKDLQPMHQAIDEMLTRLEEFETLMKVVAESDENFSRNAFLKILGCKEEMDTLRTRVAHLQVFINRVNDDLSILDRQIELAETHLGVPDNKLKSFLKPFLNKIVRETSLENGEMDVAQFTYVPPKTFKTSDYFQS